MAVRDPKCSQCGGATGEMWQCKGCGKIWCRDCLYRQQRNIIGNRLCTCGTWVGVIDRLR